MKKLVVILCIAFMATSAFISRPAKSSIYGTIDPTDGAKKVWAISGTDSASAIPSMGKFSIDVDPGTWMVYVEAVKPYKNATVSNILVQENQSTDAGVIKLEQE